MTKKIKTTLREYALKNGLGHLLDEWDYDKNGDLTPDNVSYGSGKKVWWKLPYDDSETGKSFIFEWDASIDSRIKGNGCPYLVNQKIFIGYNDLATKNPKLASEWHPIKNGNLKPTDVCVSSNKKVWWLINYKDPINNKYFKFEWQAVISDRNNGKGCPYLSNKKVLKGFNDLGTANPELAKQWHSTKNGNLKPSDVTPGSNKKVWWLINYRDPDTNKKFILEWEAVISSRVNGRNCPYLVNKKVLEGFNDLKTINPNLAKEWHPIKNGNLKSTDVTVNSGKKVWWLLPYDDPITGKHFDFEWEATIKSRNNGNGCPFLSNQKVWDGFNDLSTTNPKIAQLWLSTKNKDLKPSDVTFGSDKEVWWKCPHCNHEFKYKVYSVYQLEKCPSCKKKMY